MRKVLERNNVAIKAGDRTPTLRVATEDEIATVLARARARFSLANDAVLAELRSFNPQIFQSILCGDEFIGLAAWLPLNDEGGLALLEGRLDPLNPDQRWLCTPGVKPQAA